MRLSALARLFGATTIPNHRALDDARATVDVLHGLIELEPSPQVVGNVLSEWLQMAGLVFLTKELAESGSKESPR